MKQLFYFFFLSIIFAHCISCTSRVEANFNIENRSDFDLDSIQVLPDNQVQFFDLKSGENLTITTNMSNEQNDGAYHISYRIVNTDQFLQDSFGYYTNGAPLESTINYSIESKAVSDAILKAQELSLLTHLEELYEWRYEDGGDPKIMVQETGALMVDILQHRTLQNLETEVSNLTTISSEDGKINVYDFYYYSGGTAGDIFNSIIQWPKSDGSYGAYELFPADKRGFFGIEASFMEIYKLPAEDREVYLLLGQAKGSSRVSNYYALVIQIKNDYLILDYPAFLNEGPALAVYDDHYSGDMASMYYDLEQNVLIIDGLGKSDEFGVMEDSYSLLTKLPYQETIKFRFDGKRFRKSR